MLTSSARFATANGSRLLQQLCKHFAHKVEVEFDETRGSVVLGSGRAELQADGDSLSARVEAEDARSLIEVRYVIDKHLVTFAFRENFTGFEWSLDPAPLA